MPHRKLSKHERWFFIIVIVIFTQLILQIGKAIFFASEKKQVITLDTQKSPIEKNETANEKHGSATSLKYIETETLIQKGWKPALATKPIGKIEIANTIACPNGSRPVRDDYSSTTLCMTAEILNTDCITPDGNVIKEGDFYEGYKAGDPECKKEKRQCKGGKLLGNTDYILNQCTPNIEQKQTCKLADGTIIPEGKQKILFKQQIVDKDHTCEFVESICNNGVLENKHDYKAESCEFTNSYSQEYIENKPRIIDQNKGEIQPQYLQANKNIKNPQNCTLPRGETIEHTEKTYTFKEARVPFEESCTFSIIECNNGIFIGGEVFEHPNCQPQKGQDCTLNGKPIEHGQTITTYKQGSIQANGNYLCPSTERECNDGSLLGDQTYNLTICELGVIGKARCNHPNGGTPIEHGRSITAYSTTKVSYDESCQDYAEKRTCQNGTLLGSFQNTYCEREKGASCTTPRKTTIEDGESVIAYGKQSYQYSENCEANTEKRTCQNGTLLGSYQFGTCNKEEPKSCSLPNGTTVNHEAIVTLYQYNEVFGEAEDGVDECPRQVRKCNDGTRVDFNNIPNPFSYQYTTCNVIPPDRK